MKVLKEQLRQKEEQLQANQQQLSLLTAELRDTSSTRDRTMSDLYHMKVEADALCQAKTEAQTQCARLERLVEQLKAEAKQEAVRLRYIYIYIYTVHSGKLMCEYRNYIFDLLCRSLCMFFPFIEASAFTPVLSVASDLVFEI